MNPSPQTGTVPVTATREHTNREGSPMRKQKGLLIAMRGILDLGDIAVQDVEWTHKPAIDGRPEMWRGKVNGVEIWCKGLNPLEDLDGEQIVGDIEVKLNQVTQRRADGDEDSRYLYVNVLPPTNDNLPIGHVFIVRPPKEGKGRDRVKVLPADFNDETDYVIYRQGQPWQVVQIRE